MSACSSHDCIFISCDSPWTSIDISEIRTYNNIDTITLATLPIISNSSMHITSRILGVRESGLGADGETWQYTAITQAKNIAGIITISPPVITSFLDTVEPILTFDTGVDSVLINLIGAAGKTIHWVSKTDMINISYS